MNKEEILQKAIEKAESNGYKFWNIKPNLVTLSQDGERWFYKKSPYNYYASIHATIFSHSFAKAFWGEENFQMKKMKPHSTDYVNDENKIVGAAFHALLSWEYHLQMMVLEEDPLEYLAKFLKGE